VRRDTVDFLEQTATERIKRLLFGGLTRRGWLGAALGMLLAPGVRGFSREQLYRVDATIVLLGVPVFTKSDVGSGWARMAEEPGGRRLQFAAGSWPEKARGLNRLGFVEERASAAGSTYFGFMTASGEESFAEAKRALEKTDGAEAKYTAIAGEVGPGRAECRKVNFVFPAKYSWSRWEELFPLANEAFAKEAHSRPTQAGKNNEASHSFLSTLVRHMEAGEGTHSHAFVYANREMRLQSKIGPGDGMLRMDGRTMDGGKTLTRFRLWYRKGTPLPVRVDVQVRSFLRLTLRG
jgi:hypothetical protein